MSSDTVGVELSGVKDVDELREKEGIYMFIAWCQVFPLILYKPDAPKTTTVHVSDTRTDMLHCTALALTFLSLIYKSIITPHYRALAVYAHSALGHRARIPARALNGVL